jgi:hypothetical protein
LIRRRAVDSDRSDRREVGGGSIRRIEGVVCSLVVEEGDDKT